MIFNLKMGSAPASGAADDAIVVGIAQLAISNPTIVSAPMFGARARRTAAGAAAVPNAK
jgi:hypothetical protein